MLPDVVLSPDQPPVEQVSTPLSAQILEFCKSELFPETIQNSEVASSSNGCYEEQSSYTTNPSDPWNNMTKCPTLVDTATIALETKATAATATPTTSKFLIFEEESIENDISTPLDLTNTSSFTNHQYPFSNEDQFDLSLLQNQVPLTTYNNTIDNGPFSSYVHTLSNDHVVPIIRPSALPTVCEEDSLSSMPPSKFMRLNNPLSPNCSFIDPSIHSYLPGSSEGSGTFNVNLLLGSDILPNELEFQGDNGGMFCTDLLQCSFNSNELQALSNESQYLVNGGGSSTTPLASEITSLESDAFRNSYKLSSKERKEKIHRYMKKRNERNFSKKIKYACRKTLADSRPRVRGRFAKNDEFGENNRTNSNHEEDTDEDNQHVAVKDEEENFESSDILSQLSGVNSFKCKYSIQSWI
ncbi:hypothetical protein Ccrd_021352 [Cynara cardunculus var. scolymus]|uniref:CCT domain-containing protein n=2 Tax=Cynara cardunculus var. scolymus TaxID=59895 RepID=A0A103Y0U1_CYNCS|nr:hypothetical protein Ccrd_021352 [Cynara cardunculus var. scolymus]